MKNDNRSASQMTAHVRHSMCSTIKNPENPLHVRVHDPAGDGLWGLINGVRSPARYTAADLPSVGFQVSTRNRPKLGAAPYQCRRCHMLARDDDAASRTSSDSVTLTPV